VLPDRIETGTYAMAVAMTGGDVLLEGARPELLQAALDVLIAAGAESPRPTRASASPATAAGIRPVDVTTAPFPGFPTDLQAQFMALMTAPKGTSRITETIFENRFMHVQELARLGARTSLDGEMAIVAASEKLKGAPVMATDLRASVSLVIAGSPPRARRWSTASIISIAASSGSRKSSVAAAHRDDALTPRASNSAGAGRRRARHRGAPSASMCPAVTAAYPVARC
jgi:UDP-N-acetylglucosamine enolpyruvyl transferase